jgi:addiction module HigA family antidote
MCRRADMPMKQPAHPGKLIRHSIEASGLSLTDAAKRLGVTRQTLSRVINGRTSLSPEMAVRVSKAFGSTVEHWMRMQLAYDLAAVEKTAKSIKVKRFPDVEPLAV